MDNNRWIKVSISDDYFNVFGNTFSNVLETICLPRDPAHGLSFMSVRKKERQDKLDQIKSAVERDQLFSQFLQEWGLKLVVRFEDHPVLPQQIFVVKNGEYPTAEVRLDGFSWLLMKGGFLTKEGYQKPATIIRALRTAVEEYIAS